MFHLLRIALKFLESNYINSSSGCQPSDKIKNATTILNIKIFNYSIIYKIYVFINCLLVHLANSIFYNNIVLERGFTIY